MEGLPDKLVPKRREELRIDLCSRTMVSMQG
jgi:hypothetical protein